MLSAETFLNFPGTCEPCRHEALMGLLSLLVGAPEGTLHGSWLQKKPNQKLTANHKAPGIVSYLNRSPCFQTFIYFPFDSFFSVCKPVFPASQFSSVYHVLGTVLATFGAASSNEQSCLKAILPLFLLLHGLPPPHWLPAQHSPLGLAHCVAPCISPSLLGT